MIRMRIEIRNQHLEELMGLLKRSEEKVFPKTESAMADAAKRIQNKWVDFASGKSELKGVTPLKRPNSKYAHSIKADRTGTFAYEIYSESKIADWIENGTADVDMKTTHPYGPKSRVSKKGVPYVIIPFRWGTPGSEQNPRVGFGNNVMTASVYKKVSNKKKFSPSKVTVSADASDHKTSNVHGELVGRAQYQWGSRLQGREFGNMNGMVRFENGPAADSPGGKRHGGYFTFRVISANSPADSWKRKGMPARHVTRAVADETRETVNALVENALMEDFSV